MEHFIVTHETNTFESCLVMIDLGPMFAKIDCKFTAMQPSIHCIGSINILLKMACIHSIWLIIRGTNAKRHRNEIIIDQNCYINAATIMLPEFYCFFDFLFDCFWIYRFCVCVWHCYYYYRFKQQKNQDMWQFFKV